MAFSCAPRPLGSAAFAGTCMVSSNLPLLPHRPNHRWLSLVHLVLLAPLLSLVHVWSHPIFHFSLIAPIIDGFLLCTSSSWLRCFIQYLIDVGVSALDITRLTHNHDILICRELPRNHHPYLVVVLNVPHL